MNKIGVRLCVALWIFAIILNIINFAMKLNPSDTYDRYDDYESEYSTNSRFGDDNSTKQSDTTNSDDSRDYYDSNSSKEADPYDVDYYENGDDFAEEWAEEFGSGDAEDGYEDAYDYWESACLK